MTDYTKIDINTYQKETKLKDGTKVLLRPMVPEDQDALYEFFDPEFERDIHELTNHEMSQTNIPIFFVHKNPYGTQVPFPAEPAAIDSGITNNDIIL